MQIRMPGETDCAELAGQDLPMPSQTFGGDSPVAATYATYATLAAAFGISIPVASLHA